MLQTPSISLEHPSKPRQLENLPLCPASIRHTVALCRALLPIDAVRALYKPAAARRGRLGQPSAGLGAAHAAGEATTVCGQTTFWSLRSTGPHLQHLLGALERAAPSACAGNCGRPLQLLLAALDAALPPETGALHADAPPPAVLEQLLFSTAPLLLASGCSEVAFAGARAVQRAMQPTLGESSGAGGAGRQSTLLRRGWRRCCLGVCNCLVSSCPAEVRLQACLAAEAAAECLGPAAVEWGPDATEDRGVDPGAAAGGSGHAGGAPASSDRISRWVTPMMDASARETPIG
jgi:hypothetical protein